jgi:hypothetical protein
MCIARRPQVSYHIMGPQKTNTQKCTTIGDLKILICTQASSSSVTALLICIFIYNTTTALMYLYFILFIISIYWRTIQKTKL